MVSLSGLKPPIPISYPLFCVFLNAFCLEYKGLYFLRGSGTFWILSCCAWPGSRS
jgi:hypothetical protein